MIFRFFRCVSIFIHLKDLAQPLAMKATQDAGFATTADKAGGTGNDSLEKRDCREQHEKGVHGSK